MRWMLLVLAAVLVFAVPAPATTSRIFAPLDWWPVASPDGSHVALTRVFGNHMELYSLDLRTHRTVRIGSNAGQLGPTWSSDGRQLAYASGGQLWVVAADGSGKHRYLAPTAAFAPSWRPGTAQLAYLTSHGSQNTDLWVGGTLWAADVIGRPAWSPDGSTIAFQRDDGIYVARAPQAEVRIASIANPGPPAWSRDGTRVAFSVTSVVFVVPADGSTTPRAVANALRSPGAPAWAPGDHELAVPFQGGVTLVRADGGGPGTGTLVVGAAGPGVAYRPGTGALLATGAQRICPAHAAIASFSSGHELVLSGSCQILGTAKADVIEGTASWGDVVLAGGGNDSVHVNDGHTDRVDCGPGRDTVWADRTDRLVHCEVVHR